MNNFQPLRAASPILSSKTKLLAMALAVGTLTISAAALAASTDIANQPLATRPNVQAKPNLLFILDDSGSMDSAYMPDSINNNDWRGYYSAQCNGLAFDPSLDYPPPVHADGTSYANASFKAAKRDGYVSDSTTSDLSNDVYYVYQGSQARMGWAYTSSGVVTNDFFKECKTSTNQSATADALFKPVVVTSTSAEAQKYANWYSYYRKRYLLMRTAVGEAFKRLDSNYRVGFSRINKDTIQVGANFRDVRDFDASHKADFYSSLYGAEPDGWTPLRAALSKAGRYFAKKVSNQSYDPVQYSCQRNIALLSTDGYWNKSYGVDLDGDNVGQRDGTEARPMRDGSTQIVETEVVTHTAPVTRNEIVTTTQTRTSTRTSSVTSSTAGEGSCDDDEYRRIRQPLKRVDTRVSKRTTPQSGIATYTTTTVRTDGVVTSGPTDNGATYTDWINTPGGTTTNEGPTETLGTWVNNGNQSVSCRSSKGSGVVSYIDEQQGNYTGSPVTTSSNLLVGAYSHGSPVVTTESVGGSPNTLADVAQYYYKTDLRTTALGNCTSGGVNVCPNSVPTIGADAADWQHMNTYTIGMGVSGTLPYSRDYLTQPTGTYADLKAGRINWPQPEGYNSGSGEGGNATNVDDLWHAAVNGRGQYYSALNASSLADAINGVVTDVKETPGAAAAASTSSVDLVVGDSNQVFRASYTTVSWTGDLQAFSIDGKSGVISSTPVWSAQTLLDAKTPSARNIYFNNGGSLAAFNYGNLSAAQKAYFDNICSQPGPCADLTGTEKAAERDAANLGTNLVNYLRGDTALEGTLYRDRKHVLGDLINGAPVRVGKPPFSYGDAGYADFVATKAGRKPVVYVAANDGMLHAFSAHTDDGGTELWAFVPSKVMPKLYKLADKNYGADHQYYVDGAPLMADIKVGNTWKTILVGGLGLGGAAYYALDITDPESPALLWEFTDANLGLTVGNPVIGKRSSDGTWVVAFASGYNNSSGDGKGHLYVLNANTGVPVLSNSDGTALPSIVTTAGSSASPSGLAKINAWVTSRSNNTIERIYGGDLEGNLWRFDFDNRVAPNLSAMKLAKLQIDATTPQPITTKPELALIANKPVVMVGTGRYLGLTDISTTAQQSIYAIKDGLTDTGWGDVRADTANFVRQTLTISSTDATKANVTDLAVDWATKGGWWVDLPHSGERVATNMALLGGTLMVGTAIPSGDACTTGGKSWFYGLDATNGGVVNSSTPVGQQWSDSALIAGQTLIRDADGNRRNLVTDTAGNIRTQDVAGASSGLGSARRSSWRELTK